MRRALPVLVLVLGLAWAAPADARAAARWPAPSQYTAALRYDSHARTLSGSERVAFVNGGPEKLAYVYLRVWPNGYGSCRRPWAHVSVTGGGRFDRWNVACTAMRVRLARALAPGSHTTLSLRVRVTVPRSANRFGQDGGVVYLGNALPLLAVDDSSGPSIEPYTDLGDPFYSLSARWSVKLDLPAGSTAATTGVVHGRRPLKHGMKRLSIVAAHARDFAIVLGSFSVSSVRTASGVLLRRYWTRGSDGRAAKATLEVARGAVDTYTSWYGSPRVNEIDIVPGPSSLGPFGTGMEFPGLVLAPDVPETVAHELAHQWWYSLVGDDQWRSPWLDEAFAEYSARRLPAAVVGAGESLRCDNSDPVTSYGGDGPLTASMSHWDSAGASEYYNSVYLGGACALQSLEDELGRDAMTSFLHGYANAHRFGVVTTDDFVSALRAVAPPSFDVDAWLRRARIVSG